MPKVVVLLARKYLCRYETFPAFQFWTSECDVSSSSCLVLQLRKVRLYSLEQENIWTSLKFLKPNHLLVVS